MKKLLILTILAAFAAGAGAQEKREVLVKKYFKNNNTFIIICKGYPREGLARSQAMETAKEAALLNAQIIARETFKDSVDVVKGGSVLKYVEHDDYAVVHYALTQHNLRAKLKK